VSLASFLNDTLLPAEIAASSVESRRFSVSVGRLERATE